MNKELIINATPTGVEIALLEDKKLVELHNEKTDANFAVGDLYLGKVKKIIPEVRTDVRQKISDNKIDSLIHGGQADAYRHALWMALTAKHIGDKKARRVGQMHEESNKVHFYNSEKEDNALQDSISCQMDLLNNDLGIAYGIGYKDKSDDELKELVLNGILAGEFFMLFRNKQNEFLKCFFFFSRIQWIT